MNKNFNQFYSKLNFPKNSRTAAFADFIRGCCGVYGMYIGISMITFIEIAYFFFFRHAYDYKDNTNSSSQ